MTAITTTPLALSAQQTLFPYARENIDAIVCKRQLPCPYAAPITLMRVSRKP